MAEFVDGWRLFWSVFPWDASAAALLRFTGFFVAMGVLNLGGVIFKIGVMSIFRMFQGSV